MSNPNPTVLETLYAVEARPLDGGERTYTPAASLEDAHWIADRHHPSRGARVVAALSVRHPWAPLKVAEAARRQHEADATAREANAARPTTPVADGITRISPEGAQTLTPARPYRVHHHCHLCVGGRMAYTGVAQATLPMRYEHACGACGARRNLSVITGSIEYLDAP